MPCAYIVLSQSASLSILNTSLLQEFCTEFVGTEPTVETCEQEIGSRFGPHLTFSYLDPELREIVEIPGHVYAILIDSDVPAFSLGVH